MRRSNLVVALVVGGVVFAGGVGFMYWRAQQIDNPIPERISQVIDFPLLYPTKLPQGYQLDKTSFQANAGPVVTYSARNPKGKRMIFSIQPRPDTFDFNAFYAQGLANTAKFSTDNGEAATGTARNKLIGSIATEKSWLLLTTEGDDLPVSDMQMTLKSLKLTAID